MGKWLARLKEKNSQMPKTEGDKTDKRAFVGFVSSQSEQNEKFFACDMEPETDSDMQKRLKLEEELRFLKERYDACVRLRQSHEHTTFSEHLLWHEAKAFERMERQREELLHQLSLVTPRGD